MTSDPSKYPTTVTFAVQMLSHKQLEMFVYSSEANILSNICRYYKLLHLSVTVTFGGVVPSRMQPNRMQPNRMTVSSITGSRIYITSNR